MLRQFASKFRSKKLCLIADNSLLIRRAASTILHDMRFQVAEADNGQDVLAACREQKPDAVLLDGMIAKQGSFSYLRMLANDSAGAFHDRIKIILCTAERNPTEIARAIDAGADEYLVKPFDRAVLYAKFHQLGLTA
ncbi:MAG: response regulator [Hyphomicrobiales bacterium]|nr:response regulator [Hyphomicrobiales bacterium]